MRTYVTGYDKERDIKEKFVVKSGHVKVTKEMHDPKHTEAAPKVDRFGITLRRKYSLKIDYILEEI